MQSTSSSNPFTIINNTLDTTAAALSGHLTASNASIVLDLLATAENQEYFSANVRAKCLLEYEVFNKHSSHPRVFVETKLAIVTHRNK